jgi:hypothetical protein
VRSLQDHIAFIINIYQHNKFFHSLSFLPLKKFRIYENIRIVEILLALIWVGGRGTIKSRTRTFVVLQLVTNVAALIENT